MPEQSPPPSFEPQTGRVRPTRPRSSDQAQPAPKGSSEADARPPANGGRVSIMGRDEAASPRGNSGPELRADVNPAPAGGAMPPAFAPRNRRRPNGSASDAETSRPRVRRAPTTPVRGQAQLKAQSGRSPVSRPPKPPRPPRPRKKRRVLRTLVTLLLVAVVAWPVGLMFYIDRSLHRIDAGTGPNTEGTTYLFAGSDSRDGWNEEDPTEGERSDSAILIHKAKNGQVSMVSIPRDAYVDLPGYGMNKFNTAFAWGGPTLMVQTAEQLTGLSVDHYVQIGMAGVSEIVNALGGVELCWDYDVSDPYSGMEWVAGCHEANGEEALAFSRMRYEDPTGDLGRTLRQRQVLGAISSKALSPKTLLNPSEQLRLGEAGAEALTVGEHTHVWDIGLLLLAMRNATEAGLVGAPPISNPSLMTDVGSVMTLDEARAPEFFRKMREGQLTPDDFAVTY